MSNYSEYNVEDFAENDSFIKWCIEGDEDSELFWSQIIKQYPQKAKTIYDAKTLVIDLYHIQKQQIITKYSTEIWEGIQENILQNTEFEHLKVHKGFSFWQYAASVSVLIISMFGFLHFFSYQNNSERDLSWIKVQNNTSEIKTYTLSDNSKIKLEPYSTLKYPKEFDKKKRIIFLTGEAFFEVAKDSLRPFMVYAHETITKVLGTSFRISAYEGQKTIKVDVTSGKVAVYANVKSEKGTKDTPIYIYADKKITIPQPNKKLELTPNQTAIFDATEDELIKTVMDKPVILNQKNENLPFEYVNAPATKVFDALEIAYGIEIEYNHDDLNLCTITTKLDDEPFLEKLDILCAALNLRYDEHNAKISIKGDACK